LVSLLSVLSLLQFLIVGAGLHADTLICAKLVAFL
jgi:hypothetical protein